MKQYNDLVRYILEEGTDKADRTGTGTRSVFGYQMRFDLQKGFPLLTTKKVHFKSIAHELIWFLKGNTNIKYLKENSVSIWDEWADENGNLGRIYGAQWRDFGGIDQISNLVKEIKKNPNSRRMIVSAWNPVDVPQMALPPCHMMFQCNVANNKLSLQMYQRSCDVFLGLPFNIASYALLTEMIAQVCGLKAGELIITLGDAHLYNNHIDKVKMQLTRSEYKLPFIELDSTIKNIFHFEYSDINLLNYQSHPLIKAKVAV